MAIGRRGRKTTAKRKPKRKAAPARKKKARAKAPSKKKRTKAKATKRKPARRARTRTAKKTKPQGARTKMVRRMRRPAAAEMPPPIPEAAPAPGPRPAPIPRAMPAAPPAGDDLELAVERALGDAGYAPPDPTAVAVLAAIGRGYAQGPASPPSWLHVDVAQPIAEGLVERFATGDRAHDIDRGSHRPTTRATVNIVLSQTGGDPVGDPERAVLASFCLGSWDPATDEHAERNGIAGFVIPWYMAGRA